MLDRDFLKQFKRNTEANWSRASINPNVYGFQFQGGTRWNAGLSEQQIAEYERILGVRFPDEFKVFLREMNGTDLPTLNIYGTSGEPARQSLGVYSYPKDIDIVMRKFEEIRANRQNVVTDLAEQGFKLPGDANLVPIYDNRYVVCTSDPSSSVVLSVVLHDTDVIVYANSLKEYLSTEFLRDSSAGANS